MPERFPTLPVHAFLSLCRTGYLPDNTVQTTSPLPPAHEKKGTLPLVDVRSPSEFAQGHIPGAVNVPLFSDEERAQVGTLYKQEGNRAATLHALSLIGPRMAEFASSFLALCAPSSQADTSADIALHCWRGGMRSQSVAWLLESVGLRVYLLQGGYKSYRRFALETFARPWNLRVLGGKTGSGKTLALLEMKRTVQVVDLEGLAHHRGSAFGAYEGIPQPSCEHFENRLALALATCDASQPIWVEDESENLGRVNQPRDFYTQLRTAPVVIMETPTEQRLARVLEEYGTQSRKEMAECLYRIRKRLGGLEHGRATAFLEAGDLSSLAGILLDYYDRAYAKQLQYREPVATVQATSPENAAEKLCALPCCFPCRSAKTSL